MAVFQSLLVLAIAGFVSAASAAVDNPSVRVRMETKLKKLDFEAVGLQIFGREENIQQIALPHAEDVHVERTTAPDGIKKIWKLTRNGKDQLIFDRYVMIKNMQMRKGGQYFPTRVILSARGDAFDVIGVLPLENYLIGVVASEMPLSWPMEALKAQAVAARSYTLVQMRERAGQIFHVESNILDQVFTHISQHQEESGLTAKAKEAVVATAGVVLFDRKRQILKAYYHSDCGGKTSNAAKVWGFGSSTGVAVDSWCPSNPKAHWSFEIGEKSLAEKLAKFLKEPQATLLGLVAMRPSAEDRVEKVKLRFQAGNGKQMEKTILAAQFREAVGFDQMRSTFFDMQKKDSDYIFIGQGFGHGVGLCQWGARAQAKAGLSYLEILKHYYPQAAVELFKTRIASHEAEGASQNELLERAENSERKDHNNKNR